jgi:hypothetical protein
MDKAGSASRSRAIHRRWFVFVSLCVCLTGLGSMPMVHAAQDSGYAAVIVDLGDGRVVVRVVAFSEETITGAELLLRSGLDAALLSGWGAGTAVCALEDVGCPPTPQDCFCQCRGADCRYWNYFHLQEGRWVYAPVGAGDHRLSDGDVDGWVWGDGATAPPVLSWDEIWARSVPEPTSTPPQPTVASPAPPPTAAPTVSPAEGGAVSPSKPPKPDQPTAVHPPSVVPTSLGGNPVVASPVASLRQVRATPSLIPVVDGRPAGQPSPGDQGHPGPTSERATPIPSGALAFGGMLVLLAGAWIWIRGRK